MPNLVQNPAQQTAQTGADVAVLFIHGMGVQDRYQQLTQFVQGLEDTVTGDFSVLREGEGYPTDCSPNASADKLPKGQFIPLCISPRTSNLDALQKNHSFRRVKVDVHEVYYAPLLNGLTNTGSVLQWAVLTLFRGKRSKNVSQVERTDAQHQANLERATDDHPRQKGRRGFAALYLFIVALVSGFVFWWAIGAVKLAADHLSAPDNGYFTQHVSPNTNIFDRPLWEDGQRFRGNPQQFPGVLWGRFITGVEFAGQALAYPAKSGGSDKNGGNIPAFTLSPNEVLKKLTFWDYIIGALYLLSLYWFLKHLGQLVFGGMKGRKHKKWRADNPVLGSTKDRRVPQKLPEKCGEQSKKVEEKETAYAHQRKQHHLVSALGALFATLVFAGLSRLIVTFILVPLVMYMVLSRLMRMFLRDVLGDVEVYTNRNANNAKYAGHEAVLNCSRQTIEKVLRSKRYKHVYVVAHSLGSVVGLDTLRRLYTDYALEYYGISDGDPANSQALKEMYGKIRAFVTLGSPLEKTLWFLFKDDHRASFEEFSRDVDWRIFRRQMFDDNNVALHPHCFPWFNFWMEWDIVCDPLDSYPVDKAHERLVPRLTEKTVRKTDREGRLSERSRFEVWPHSEYWRDRAFVANFLRILTFDEPERVHEIVLPGEGTNFSNSAPTDSAVESPDAETAH